MLRTILAVVAVLILLLLGRFIMMSHGASPPDHLNHAAARLEPCPDKPNCVSSRAKRKSQRVEPLVVPGPPAAALEHVTRAIEAMERSRIVTAGDGYVHAEFKSRLFRFVDDLELVYDEKLPGFQVRSASRSGHSDLGVNRKRVEALRNRLAAMPGDR